MINEQIIGPQHDFTEFSIDLDCGEETVGGECSTVFQWKSQ